MNSLFALLGIESWKPVLTVLLLPPVPLLLLVLIGARLIQPRRGWGWPLVVIGVTGLWLSTCYGMGDFLTRTLLHPPPALSREQVAALKTEVQARRGATIVVLGAGREGYAPEYGTSNLSPASMERLRYGLWLAHETGAAAGFSGGTGWAQAAGAPEAEIATRIAAQELGRALKWTEDQSRDTRESAVRTVALLKESGATRAVLVTHGWHMPRALRAFREAAAGAIEFQGAPMGLAPAIDTRSLRWLPTAEGATRVRQVLRELLGLLAGV